MNDTARVCIYIPAKQNETAEYQEIKAVHGISGNEVISFVIPPDTIGIGTLYVTVSGFNYLPFMGEILVTHGCSYVDTPEIITSTPSFPWAGSRYKNHDVIIDSNVVLTVNGNIYFVPSAKIIVKQGGQLVIDGGKLGAACEDLWGGVEVWGRNGHAQNILNQGSILVVNGGIICDAEYGIHTMRVDSVNFPLSSGGTVSCSNAKFINNKYGVKFEPFYYNGKGYNSSFSNTEFITNDEYVNKVFQPIAMIGMTDIFGITIRGCTFENMTTNQSNLASHGYGIKADNSGFLVDRECISTTTPCEQYKSSSFKGLYYGIHANGLGYPYQVTMQNSLFVNNLRGIYLSGISFAAVNRDAFETRVASKGLESSGLYLNNCTGYSVQENNFSGHSNNSETYETGIIINNSGSTSNEIYNNKGSGVFLDPSVYFNGCSAPCYTTVDGKIDSNYIHGNGEGITALADNLDGSSGANHTRYVASVIQNNLILNNAANGISLAGNVQQSLQAKIINNTIAGNGNAGINHVTRQVGFTFENNLLMLNNYGIRAQSTFNGANVLVGHNDVWGNYISNWANYPVAYGNLVTNNINGTPADTNLNLSIDPLIVSGSDFHLQVGSPVVDAGTTNLAPTVDFDGNSRSGSPDIGSFELASLLLTADLNTSPAMFDILIAGGRGTSFTIESSTNLTTWVAEANAILTNRTLLIEIPVTDANRKFYRARIP